MIVDYALREAVLKKEFSKIVEGMADCSRESNQMKKDGSGDK